AVIEIAIHARLEDRESTSRGLRSIEVNPFAAMPRVVFNAWLAEAYVLVGDTAACRRLRAAFEPHAAAHLTSGHLPMTYEGPVLRVLGLLDDALGDTASAVDRLRRALDGAAAHGHKAWVAQLSYDLGGVLARAGRRAEAADALLRAQE